MMYKAVIFDLDGVITRTALVHGKAWKRMFDEYLISREARYNEKFREFTHNGDYLPYVDGKPRYDGVAAFLRSRGINIPFGDTGDDPSEETICGLGNRKNQMFNMVLDESGVEMYESTVNLIKQLKDSGIRVGVASSSRNCKPVLERAGMLDLFETRVDGVVSSEMGLKGKPEPDIFLAAARNLGAEPSESVVVEDAVSGVMAGSKGNFGLVIGIAREDNSEELKAGGADIVVGDLEEISMQVIDDWFRAGIGEDGWRLSFHGYDPSIERHRETLLTIGNGYFGTRGAMESSAANGINYPGTYIAGLYNRRTTTVSGKDIENEDFVNIPNWLSVTFRIGDDEWFSFNSDSTSMLGAVERNLNMRTGELKTTYRVTDEKGRITEICCNRFAGMHYPHIGALRYSVKPVNYSGSVSIKSEITGDHINAGVERYNSLNQDHLFPITERIEGNSIFLEVRTTHSNVTVAVRARHIFNGGQECEQISECSSAKGRVCQDFTTDAVQGREIVLEKLVAIYTSQDNKVITPGRHTKKALARMNSYSEELALSEAAWRNLWKMNDIQISGDRYSQKLLRLHIYHLLVTVSPHNRMIDFGIPPRGLHGEAYRGHIFWDEIYILPRVITTNPVVAKSVLMYRYRRLDKARDNARLNGFRGAMFPWQSGSDGREETQVMHLNPVSGEWGPDYSSLQRHISLAVAYNVWSYYRLTGDSKFMLAYGAELLIEISRFWASAARYDGNSKRYHIEGVMGPDEFHEKMPGSDRGGVNDNAYTNIMVSWLLTEVDNYLSRLGLERRNKLVARLKIEDSEIEEWKSIASGLFLSIDNNGFIEQFRGWSDLRELDWDEYRRKYGDIHRLDRILKAENRSPDLYKLTKQADLMMAFYLLGLEGVREVLGRLGYSLSGGYFDLNLEHYLNRTSHGSTLSRLVYSDLIYRYSNREAGWRMYQEALKSDLEDAQGGTTGEGIHCGVMGGTVWGTITLFGGLDLSGETPSINPDLPDSWQEIRYCFIYRDQLFIVEANREQTTLSVQSKQDREMKAIVHGKKVVIDSGKSITLRNKS